MPDTLRYYHSLLAHKRIMMGEPLADHLIDHELYGSHAFINALDQLREHMQTIEDFKVLYPGSSTHTDVADYFGRKNVTHVDVDETTVRRLQEAGYQTQLADIHQFQGELFDLVVTLNTHTGVLSDEDITRLLRPGGYIVTNMYPLIDLQASQGIVKLVTTVNGGESMGPHFQENSLGLYQDLRPAQNDA